MTYNKKWWFYYTINQQTCEVAPAVDGYKSIIPRRLKKTKEL